MLWAAGWGSGPVSPRKSLFRDFPNERPTRHHARESRGFCCPAPLAAAGIRFCCPVRSNRAFVVLRSEEHTSELQSLMRISYAVFCLTKKTPHTIDNTRKILSSRNQLQI